MGENGDGNALTGWSLQSSPLKLLSIVWNGHSPTKAMEETASGFEPLAEGPFQLPHRKCEGGLWLGDAALHHRLHGAVHCGSFGSAFCMCWRLHLEGISLESAVWWAHLPPAPPSFSLTEELQLNTVEPRTKRRGRLFFQALTLRAIPGTAFFLLPKLLLVSEM